MPGSDLEIGYDIRLATDDFVSVEFSESAFSQGAAHPNNFTIALNFDVKKGKKLALADLFKPKSNYLNLLSTYCVADLKKQSKSKNDILSDDTIKSGASPKNDNYKVWAITKKGLLITFDPYQVGPYAAGVQYVLVPWTAMTDVINPDGPIGQLSQSG
jgi:hypothetical protein